MADSADTTNPIPRKCSVEGCDLRHVAKGLCGKHYQRVRQTGQCSVESCGRVAKVRGMCTTHYDRWHKHGDDFERGEQRTANGAGIEFLRANVSYNGQDCLIWPFSRFETGYARIGGKRGQASRYMCTLAHGEPFVGAEAAHSCGKGDEGCVNPRHLRWATRKENEADKELHGTRLRGEGVGNSRLSSDQAIAIYNDQRSQADIAKDYDISPSHVSIIKSGKLWSHVTGHKRRDAA